MIKLDLLDRIVSFHSNTSTSPCSSTFENGKGLMVESAIYAMSPMQHKIK